MPKSSNEMTTHYYFLFDMDILHILCFFKEIKKTFIETKKIQEKKKTQVLEQRNKTIVY